MATISLCMIVKNEQDVLARCLESVAEAVDEIVIVDTGSTDQTIAIAKQYTDHVYSFGWVDDFAAARNFAFSKGKMDYLMWLDADDVLLEEDRKGLLELKTHLDADMVMMRYNVAFDPQGHPTFSYYRERLMRRSCGYRWLGVVHEAIIPSGKVIHSEIAVTHRKEKPSEPGRNLKIFRKQLQKGIQLDARQQFYYARELFYAHLYREAEEQFRIFLANPRGWLENKLEACRQLAACQKQQGNAKGAMDSLVSSFTYAVPRAETCCDLGKLLMEENRWEEAAFWYETALRCPRKDEQGGFNQRGIDYYVERAKGGTGLIITGVTFFDQVVEKQDPSTVPNPLYKPVNFVKTSREMTERVHAYGSKIFLQLSGGFGRVTIPTNVGDIPPIAPSPIPHRWLDKTCREISVDEIHAIVRQFGEAAFHAKRAGFDGVQIHAVHEGYLMDQFAISMFNQRTDEYGGSLENRLRFAREPPVLHHIDPV